VFEGLMSAAQPNLFETPRPDLPEGLVYRPDFLDAGEQASVVQELAQLPYKPFEFRGYLGNRRVVSYGWRYDFNQGGLKPAEPVPAWLEPLRARAEAFAGLAPGRLRQALLTEYAPGAGIGWHRDRPQFEDVVGVSFLAPAVLRFRQKAGAGWRRAAFTAEPGSAYLLRGPSRTDWEHSITPLDALRYSITFRSFRPGAQPTA
jgi:alkylated DNA repair dioxygenase AlkB